MTPDEFQKVIEKIRPYTNYIYLHVLGEPLLHPKFEEILSIAENALLNINITTNGGLIEKRKEILLQHSIRQINISLHDAEENVLPEKWSDYLNSVLEYATEASSKTYINLRLWNAGVNASTDFNRFCLEKIAFNYDKTIEEITLKGKDSGIKLSDHIFLQHAPRFEWPDGEKIRSEATKTCYALRDQIAILVDGTVVPCCLDGDGNMNLGNIFNSDLAEILHTERSLKIRNGFISNQITEEFCKSCGFFIS